MLSVENFRTPSFVIHTCRHRSCMSSHLRVATNSLAYQDFQIATNTVWGPHARIMRDFVITHVVKQRPGQNFPQTPLAGARPLSLRQLHTAWSKTLVWLRLPHVCCGLGIGGIKTCSSKPSCEFNVAEIISPEIFS